MAIYGMVNQKGGVGKTTTAVFLVFWLQSRGHKVLLIDADAQQSSSAWAARAGLKSVSVTDPDDIDPKVRDAIAYGYEDIVIDGPASLGETTLAIAEKADRLLIPCKAGVMDVEATMATVKKLRRIRIIRGGLPDASFVISMAKQGTRLIEESRNYLVQTFEDVPCLKTIVYHRTIVADMPAQGISIWQYKEPAAREAAQNFENLFVEWIGNDEA